MRFSRHLVAPCRILEQFGAQLKVRARAPLALRTKVVWDSTLNQFIEQLLQQRVAPLAHIPHH